MTTSRPRVLLLLLILAGTSLRLYTLGGQSLWYDEGVTATIAQRDLMALTAWTANDIQPPLYYYLIAVWGRMAGWSEWALRLPSAFLGVATIPLLFAVARRLLGTAGSAMTAGLLAATFATVHPLLIYYGQEARMYTLLVCLSILLTYLLLRLADAPAPHTRLWAAYVVVAAAALYTHYFALFLLVGLGCAWMVDLRKRPGATQCLRRYAVANAAVIVLYLPWLANVLMQYRVDRSYWLGDLKLHEALLDVALRFTSGETMAERTAIWLLPVYAAITLAACWGISCQWPQARRLLLYAAFWLFVPVIAVLALAFNVPKFNPRYVMLALPGLLLVWAGGLAALATQGSGSKSRASGRVLAALCVSLLVGGALWSNANWFFDRAFAKDNWRDLSAFLRERVADDEQIVLVSGHAWPVWQYYAADLPVVRLPELEILNVDAVLDFASTQGPLAAAFAEKTGKAGAWLVNWQDEVVDPNNVTPVQLELGGREKGQSATFQGLTLRRFGGIRAARFAAEPPVAQVLDASFGEAVTLHGYTVLNNGDLLLFWQRPTPAETAGDLRLALETVTLDGRPLARPQDRRLAGYTHPSFRWPQDEIVMGHIAATDWLGAEPVSGTVEITLRVYDGRDPFATSLTLPSGADHLTLRPVEVVID